MTSTTTRSREQTEEQLRQLQHHLEHGVRGPILAEHLLAAAAQVLRLNELELMEAEENASVVAKMIVRNAWAESRGARVTITDAVMPMLHQTVLRRLHAEEYVDLAAA